VSILQVEALKVHYGGIAAVRQVDLRVQPGEVLALLGANGAGKSSTLRAIVGLVGHDGTVEWDGADVSRWRPHRIALRGVVLVPEGRKVFDPLTVEENLLLGAYGQKSGSLRRDTLSTVVDMFPVLGERSQQKAGLLSGGEQQMLAFGRALMSQPRIILMDEPSLGLAPVVVERVMESVAQIASTGIGVLMVEQNARMALKVATRGAVLERGAIKTEGTAAELSQDTAILEAFLGNKAGQGSIPPPVMPEPPDAA
jgi:branched-chain amino acid transport system ATP-binding protein